MSHIPDRQRLHKAFRTLQSLGYETSEGEWCCNTCTVADFVTDKFVYFTEQDMDVFDEDGNLIDLLYLGWGEDGDKEEIASTLEFFGLVVTKPETDATKFLIQPTKNITKLVN